MLCLLDISSDYWRNWYATRSELDAYQLTVEHAQWYAAEYPRTVVCAEGARAKRFELFAEYKANRTPAPQEARDTLRAVLEQLAEQLPVISCEGYEADDVIASIVAAEFTEEIAVVSNDKDLYQLISESTKLHGRRGSIGPAECLAKFGVHPYQVRDWLALSGDSADNIPGCPGVGPGRARDLLREFDTLDAIKRASALELQQVRGVGKSTVFALQEWDPTLALSLVTLMTDAPVAGLY